jgi:hypothetical protein
MRKIILTVAMVIQFNPFGTALASSEVCNRETFTHEELSNPYSLIKKPLEKYSLAESQRIAQAINRNAKEESNSFHRPCLPNTKSCFGHDQAWTYRKELIIDNLRNPLRYNGEIASKRFVNWPAGKYYAHQTRIGYSCSWGGNLKPQCEKWCSLVVNDARFHD